MNLKTVPAHPGTPPIIRAFRLPVEQIGYATSLVEAYDGIGHVRTLDRGRGIVELWIMPDYAAVWDRLIEGLREEFPLQEIGQSFD